MKFKYPTCYIYHVPPIPHTFSIAQRGLRCVATNYAFLPFFRILYFIVVFSHYYTHCAMKFKHPTSYIYHVPPIPHKFSIAQRGLRCLATNYAFLPFFQHYTFSYFFIIRPIVQWSLNILHVTYIMFHQFHIHFPLHRGDYVA